MAKHLGDFGTPRAARDDTFGWMGEVFRVHPEFTDLNLVRFIERAVDIDEEDEAEAMKLVRSQFGGIVHPDDYIAFLDVSIANRQTATDLLGLMKGLNEAYAGRPTKRPSDSRSGRRKTGGRSKAGSSKQGTARRVIDRLADEGRPDLALTVVAADDARQTA